MDIWLVHVASCWFTELVEDVSPWLILPSTNYETGGFNPPCAEKQPNIGARTCHSGWNTKWTNGTVLPPSRRLSPPTVSGTNEKEIGIVFVGPLWVGGIWILSLYIYVYIPLWIQLDKWYLDSVSIYIYMCVYTHLPMDPNTTWEDINQTGVISHTSPKSYDWIHKVSRYGHFKREAPWVTSGFRTHPKDNPLHMKELRDLK